MCQLRVTMHAFHAKIYKSMLANKKKQISFELSNDF